MATTRRRPRQTACDTTSGSSPVHKGPLERRAQQLLLALLAEIEALGELREALLDAPDVGLACLRQVGIPYRPAAWFGPQLDAAARQAFSRAAKCLETGGLVRRVAEPQRDRITHLQLTAEGLHAALELAGP